MSYLRLPLFAAVFVAMVPTVSIAGTACKPQVPATIKTSDLRVIAEEYVNHLDHLSGDYKKYKGKGFSRREKERYIQEEIAIMRKRGAC